MTSIEKTSLHHQPSAFKGQSVREELWIVELNEDPYFHLFFSPFPQTFASLFQNERISRSNPELLHADYQSVTALCNTCERAAFLLLKLEVIISVLKIKSCESEAF